MPGACDARRQRGRPPCLLTVSTSSIPSAGRAQDGATAVRSMGYWTVGMIFHPSAIALLRMRSSQETIERPPISWSHKSAEAR